MDPVAVFTVAALMMLANGGVLGLVHADLPASIQPAAVSWRIATLLIAGGCLLFTVQGRLPQGFLLPIANGLVMVGFTGYWRALRQFYGRPDRIAQLVPALLGTAGIVWYAAIDPAPGPRILIVSVAWTFILLACVRELRLQSSRDPAISRRVLSGVFLVVSAFTSARAAYFGTVGVRSGFAVTDASTVMNAITPMIAAVLPVIGTTGFLLLCSERIRRQWERAASTDALTGLPNRRTLMDSGRARFAQARGRRGGLAVAIVDVDHFKAINDRHGHEIGDVALCHVAGRLEQVSRGTELPARLGGEEFVVLLDDVDAEGAAIAGERLRASVARQPFVAGSLSLPITVSIGVAVGTEDDADFDALLRRADAALYAAKAGGRDRVVVAEGSDAGVDVAGGVVRSGS